MTCSWLECVSIPSHPERSEGAMPRRMPPSLLLKVTRREVSQPTLSSPPPRTAPGGTADSPAASPPPTVHRTSSSSGDPTTIASACARDTATLSRLGLSRNSAPARRLVERGGAERHDHDRRLLPLELVHRPDPRRWPEPLAQAADLQVERRDDEDVAPASSAASTPRGPPPCRPSSSVDDRARWPRPPRRSTGRSRRASTGTQTMPVSAGTSAVPGAPEHPMPRGLRDAVEPALVDRIRDEPAHVRVHPPGGAEEDARVRRGRWRGPASRYSRQERPVSPGWLPWVGWASCIWSPMRIRLRADWPTATALARETWPASSMKR